MKVETSDGIIEAEVANGLFSRMRGLIGRAAPAAGHGLLIPHCNAIHTLFMRYPIDVHFLDAANREVRCVRNIRPGRFWVWGGFKARKVLEVKT